MKETIYLDYNATALLHPEVAAMLSEKMMLAGNPSSIHSFGRNARKEIERAREQVAKLVNTDAINVTFTSGATEANNTVLFGAPVTRILYSAIEHPSVYDTAKEIDNTIAIPVLRSGVVDLEALEKLLSENPMPTLVSVMWVNNETGVIQPVAEIAALAQKYHARFHCDAVQAAGRVDIDLQKIKIDYLTLSAHKIGGPAGIGALIYDHHTPLEKFVHGGGQERRRRAGTENTIGILGFGMAAEIALKNIAAHARMTQWRDALEAKMKHAVPQVEFIGSDAPRVGNTIQMVLPGVSAEKQLMALDLDGVAVSSGAACSSGSVKPSHVLLAMGLPQDKAVCAIRLSMGSLTTETQLESFLTRWVANSQRLLNS